jgi:hypothetical protein
MAIERALVQELEDDTGVGDLCGDRIYARKAPQNPTYPYVVYHIDGTNEHTYYQGGVSGLAQLTVGITVVAETYGEVVSLALAVANAIQGKHGTLGSGGGDDEESDVYVQLVNWFDTDEKVDEGSDDILFGRTQDYEIWYHEAIPS